MDKLMEEPLVWLITGASCGFGRALALEALKRGDKVIATGRKRSINKVAELESHGANVMELDVTAPLETLHDIVDEAAALHGKIDVLVNNAGYLLVGTLEESTPKESFDVYNTNIFGALNVTRAVLPHMRARKSGTIVFIGSMGGHMPGMAYAGLYISTKWAVRGICATLHQEIEPLGLRATSIELGLFRTEFFQPGQRTPSIDRIKDYTETSIRMEDFFQSIAGKELGDPQIGAKIVVDIMRGEGAAKGKDFPSSVCLGSDSYDAAKKGAEMTLGMLDVWSNVSPMSDFKDNDERRGA